MKGLKNPDVIVLGWSRVFQIVWYRSQKIYSQQQNILDSSSCRSGGTSLLYNNSIKRICTDRDLTMSYFATPSLLQKMAILVGENIVNTGVLQLAVLKRLVVLKGSIFNIFLKLVY